MGFFDDILATDADSFLDAFGETVVYRPRGGTPRTISAVVDRSPPKRMDAAGKISVANLEVWVKNDGTAGIAAGDTALIGAEMDVVVKLGRAATRLPIGTGNPAHQDNGMIAIVFR